MAKGQKTSQCAMHLARTFIALCTCYTALCTFEARAAPLASETETRVVENLRSFDQRKEAIVSTTSPACGGEDIVKPETETGGRTRRYALSGKRWPRKCLTYKIGKYSSKLDRSTIDEEIAKAFALWSEQTDLTFAPKHGKVDIEIRFERGDHKDGYPFTESSGSILAHSFYPQSGSGVHFDDSQQWTVDGRGRINLLRVATHEIGHTLGLGHSDINSAVMAAFPSEYGPNFELDSDDISGIQALYGRKTRKRSR